MVVCRYLALEPNISISYFIFCHKIGIFVINLYKNSDFMYRRQMYLDIEQHLLKKQVTVITGMRRVGKTTAAKHLLEKVAHKNKIYLDLDQQNIKYHRTLQA